MITPMRHVTLICRQEDRTGLLERLRAFGAVHVAPVQQDNRDLETLRSRVSEVRKVIQKLSRCSEPGEPLEGSPESWVDHCQRIDGEEKEISLLQGRLLREARSWDPFGEVQPETLTALEQGGLSVAFIRQAEPPEDLPDDAVWLPAAPGFGVIISPDPLDALSDQALRMPVRGPERIRQLQSRLQTLSDRHADTLARAAARLDDLRNLMQDLEEELEFLTAHTGMDQTDDLAWIEGFVPEGNDSRLQAEAAHWGAALALREPTEEEQAPTLLRQNSFVSWIQPVFTFLGVTPGYREVDVGWSFLVFLTLFSAMIIGDAGYGALLVAGTLIVNARKPATRGRFSYLLIMTGLATVLWGVLTGNYFGVIAPWRVRFLSEEPSLMNFCFLLGSIHLSIAHAWTGLRRIRSLQSLSDLGWIGSTWTMYFIIAQMVLGHEMPVFALPMGGVSLLLIVVFMTPFAKMKEELMQHMMLPMSLINNFVDVISYVRLYAVGMATLAMASSFNDLTLGGAEGRNIFLTGLMVIVLIFGHALNCVLAGLGVIVHGVRLNTLEFSSHIGLTWSGIPYSPFKKHNQPDA